MKKNYKTDWQSLEGWQDALSKQVNILNIVPMDVPQNLDMYEYYYRRGTTYYFRNILGEKIVISLSEEIDDLERGKEYKITYGKDN